MSVTYYDKSGNKTGSSSIDNGGGALFFAIIFFGALYAIFSFFSWASETMTNWELLDAPYNYIAGFYNYIILVPINAGGDIVNWLSIQSFTNYPNVNIIITVLGVLVCMALVIGMVILLIRLLDNFGKGILLLPFLLIIPATLGIAWYILSGVFNWLTSTV